MTIQVREYARLTTDASLPCSLDRAVISEASFDWLAGLAQTRGSGGRLLELQDRCTLRLGSAVGYLEGPDGTGIEILPKTAHGSQDPAQGQAVLQKMLRSALKLTPREYGPARLAAQPLPLHEWIFSQFLTALKVLLRQGLRFQYQRVEECARFIRGQLDMSRQLRQGPGRQASFHICHDVFSPNRLENRLIKTALERVQRWCRTPDNWRLANEFRHQLEMIPAVQFEPALFESWQTGKLLRHYHDIRPWCELILQNINPAFTRGRQQGMALLFPMERLFERHVAAVLAKRCMPRWRLRCQAASHRLVSHRPGGGEPQSWFTLMPDLLLQGPAGEQVLDTKWKLLDQQAGSSRDKYGISQQDLYQLFAYGSAYQQGRGDMMLIYPRYPGFTAPLPEFVFFNQQLRLWVVPFCMERDGLVAGDWLKGFVGLGGGLVS